MTPEELLELPVKFSFGGSNRGRMKNVEATWRWLHNRFKDPAKTSESFADYLKLSPDEQNAVKNVDGFWMAGPALEGKRTRATLGDRWAVVMDMDDLTPEQAEMMLSGRSSISKLAHFLHTTRKHTPESPRLRAVFPTLEPVPIERIGAVTRIVAFRLDPTMRMVDHVSFRGAQMMYFPSHSADMGEHYRYVIHGGALLDAEKTLAKWGDWQDFDKLPKGAKENNAREREAKAEDPRDKPGIVGAFCRTYSVPEAIETFLSDKYTESDDFSSKPRYTYVHGSGNNGAVVEDDGLFLYSHHGTDPCADRLVNAFDLVRLHLYGDQDTDEMRAGHPSQMKSMQKMLAHAGNLEPVKRERFNHDRRLAAGSFDDETGGDSPVDIADRDPPAERQPRGFVIQGGLYPNERTPYDCETDLVHEPVDGPDPGGVEGEDDEPEVDPENPDEAWMDSLVLAKGGVIAKKVTNLHKIMENDPRFAGKFGVNELLHRPVIRETIDFGVPHLSPIEVHDTLNGEPVDDYADLAVMHALDYPMEEGGYGVGFPKTACQDVLNTIAQKHRFDPFRDYLKGLTWDGKPRIERIGIDFLGTPDSPYYREVWKLALLAAVARSYEPGHKFDYAIVLEGPQGIRKSTFISVLARRRWYSSFKADLSDPQQCVEQMAGFKILEFAEMATWSRAEANSSKSFMDMTKDTVRLAYARREKTYARRCIFFGTTNELQYLRDLTGNRRIWPIRVLLSMIDTEGLDEIADQLWAEAHSLYLTMREEMPRHLGELPLFLSPEATVTAKRLQDQATMAGGAGDLAQDIVEFMSRWTGRPGDLDGVDFDNVDHPGRQYRSCRLINQDVWDHILNQKGRVLPERERQQIGHAFTFLASKPDSDWEIVKVRGKHHFRRKGLRKEDYRRGYEIRDPDPDTGDLV